MSSRHGFLTTYSKTLGRDEPFPGRAAGLQLSFTELIVFSRRLRM
jgi:hypothetical protein